MEGTHKHLFTHCILIANDECKNLTGSSIKEEMLINLFLKLNFILIGWKVFLISRFYSSHAHVYLKFKFLDSYSIIINLSAIQILTFGSYSIFFTIFIYLEVRGKINRFEMLQMDCRKDLWKSNCIN